MSNNTRVLVVDDNEELRACIIDYLQKQPGIIIAGEAGNGMDALKILSDNSIDVMLLDMIMPGMDGFGLLQHLQHHMPQEKRPRIIAATALGRDDFIRRAVDLGVSYYMIKPVDLPVLADRIRDLSKPLAPTAVNIRPIGDASISLDDRLSNLFLTMGIPAHIKGYQFLREAIKLVIETPTMISGITKELYPAIARRFGTSPSKVERAIRHAIEVAWSRGRIDTLNQAFGCNVAQADAKPTNGEFIALIADKLALEHSA